jgi:iron complex outermembrane receptor protein
MGKKLFLAFLAFVSVAKTLSAAEAASSRTVTLVVHVRQADASPAQGVRVSLAGHPWVATTDQEGRARFLVAPGNYLVQAESSLGLQASKWVEVGGQETAVDLTLEAATFHEEVVVSSARPSRLADSPQSVSLLTDEALRLAAAPSLGETLRSEPGTRSTFYSPGASRPLLRGLGGDRIRILQDGLDLGDASDTSPDHGVAVETQGLERVEILRGPSALLYGSEALGGVVSTKGQGVPLEAAGVPFAGTFTTTLVSNPWERVAWANLFGQAGSFLWQASGGKRQGEDYRSALGKVANSFTQGDNGNLGVSLLQPWGVVGVSLDQFETRYGSPVEEEVSVDLWRRRLQLAGQLYPSSSWLQNLRFALAHVDYHHTEFEENEPATRVENRLSTGRIELAHGSWLGFSGIFGGEWRQRDLAVYGEESYLPRTASQSFSAFFWEHRSLARWQWEIGGRWDAHTHDPAGPLPSRSFRFASLASSLTFTGSSPWRPYVAFSLAGKAPNPEELYSQGPHAGTGLFEVGDPSLKRERSRTGELGLLYQKEDLRLKANLFYSRVDNFIFQALTGEQEEDLPVAQFFQGDSTFWGGELLAHWDLWHKDENHVELTLGGDWVAARLRQGPHLPRIPPARLTAQLAYFQPGWRGEVGVERVFPATRLAPEETRTPGYTSLAASFSRRILAGKLVHLVALRGQNLTDVRAFNHTSFFKERTPLPGRSFTLLYQVWF